jgi:sugar phosphate isomerase/epimerase
MKVGLNTFHLAARFGLNEQGASFDTNLLNSAREIAEWGVEVIELMLDICLFTPEQMSLKIVNGLRELSEETGIEYSAHLPYTYIDISCIPYSGSFFQRCMYFRGSQGLP